MSKLDALLRRVADEQDTLREGDGLPERLARRFERFSPRPRRRMPAWAALAAALALVAVFFGVRAARQPSALSVTVGASGGTPLLGAWLGAPDGNSLPLEFSDGSRFELTPKSRARLVNLGRSSARVELASGSLRVHVVPGRAAGWHIVAGPFGVRITGTRFVVSYAPDDDAFELSVEEGQVELSGCVFGTGRKLAVGQRVRASCRKRTLDVSYRDAEASGFERSSAPALAAASAAVPATPVASAIGPALSAAPESSATSLPATWQSLARAGKYREAYAAVEREGFDVASSGANAGGLTLLSDVARHARATQRAEQALLLLRRKFSGSDDAALAAFTLGRLAFDEHRSYPAAADWFRTYLKERPGGVMAREALGRLMEASSRAGDAASTQAAAKRYLRDYPTGPHAELASRLVTSP